MQRLSDKIQTIFVQKHCIFARHETIFAFPYTYNAYTLFFFFSHLHHTLMRTISTVFCGFLLSVFTLSAQPGQVARANLTTVDVARQFSTEIFILNSIPYLQPLVTVLNSTVNARFMTQVYIPKDSFYVRFSVNAMYGTVQDNQKTYTPGIPQSALDPQGALTMLSRGDTVGAALSIFKGILNRGIAQGQITVPASSPTILGAPPSPSLRIPPGYLNNVVQTDPIFLLLPTNLRTALAGALTSFPTEFPLPDGRNIAAIPFGVPQVEIGGLGGSEVMFRYIPKLRWNDVIGSFGFWGVGFRHSLSQYLFGRNNILDISIAGAYQETSLSNTIGVTNAEFNANGRISNIGLQVGKRISNNFGIMASVAYDNTTIDVLYKTQLPRQMQQQLGLLYWYDDNNNGRYEDDEWRPNPSAGYPGDTKPQEIPVSISTSAMRYTIGSYLKLGHVILSADYNMGQFNLFSAGLAVQF